MITHCQYKPERPTLSTDRCAFYMTEGDQTCLTMEKGAFRCPVARLMAKCSYGVWHYRGEQVKDEAANLFGKEK